MPSGNSQRPRVHVAPHIDATDGDLAAQFAAAYGLVPDEWQRFVLDDWLGRQGRLWGSLTAGLSVPRQNGKNALLEIRELFGAVGLGERILHTAHEVKTAQKHFRRLKYFFGTQRNDPAAKFPELNALVDTIRSVNGQEAILLTNGGSIEIVARSKNSGRGFTVDVLVMDEAQELNEDALEALMPTTSAAPLGNPQWIFTGTPPGPSADGDVFGRVRREAMGARPGRVSWHEWSVEKTETLDDRVLWRMTNPALDAGRLQEAVIEGERARFSDDGFARERLGFWGEYGAGKKAFEPEAWARLAVGFEPDGVASYGVKFTADGSGVSLAKAVRPEAGPVFVRPLRQANLGEGVQWLIDELVEVAPGAAQIVIDGKAGVGYLVNALRDAGVKNKRLVLLPTLDQVVAAHSMVEQAVYSGELSHPGAEKFDEQVLSASKRKIGNNGGFGWDAPEGETVVSLDAVTLAFWGAKTTKRRPGRGMRVSA